MDTLQNRIVAGFLCLLIILASSVVGVASTLMPMRSQVSGLFYDGTRENPGIARDLREISVQAFNLTVVAGRYLAPGYPATSRVLEARNDLDRAMHSQSPREMRRAKDALVGATQALHSTLSGLELTSQDEYFMLSLMADISSRISLIGQSPYNQSAVVFNQALTRFPANILGPAAGVRPLELFE